MSIISTQVTEEYKLDIQEAVKELLEIEPFTYSIARNTAISSLVQKYAPHFGNIGNSLKTIIGSDIDKAAKFKDDEEKQQALESLDKFVSGYVESKMWLATGYLVLGDIYWLAGKAKAGKTSLVHHLMKAVADTGEFLSKPCLKGNILLYQVEESDNDQFAKLKEQGLEISSNISNIYRRTSLSLLDVDLIEYDLKQTKPLLVILDNASAANDTNISENQADFANLFRPLEQLAHKYLCTFLILHHRTKSASTSGDIFDTMAGSGRIPSVGGGSLILEPDEDTNHMSLYFKTRNLGTFSLKIKRDLSNDFTINYVLVSEEHTNPDVFHLEKSLLRVIHESTEPLSWEHIKNTFSNTDSTFLKNILYNNLCKKGLIKWKRINVEEEVKVHFFVDDELKEMYIHTRYYKELQQSIKDANTLSNIKTGDEWDSITASWTSEYIRSVLCQLEPSERLYIAEHICNLKLEYPKVIYKNLTYKAIMVDFSGIDYILLNLLDTENSIIHTNINFNKIKVIDS